MDRIYRIVLLLSLAGSIAEGAPQKEFFSHIVGVQQPIVLQDDMANPKLHGKKSLEWATKHTVNDLNSDIIKLAIEKRHLERQGYRISKEKPTLTELAKHEGYKQLLDLPYRVAYFWAHGSVLVQYYTPKKEKQVYDEFYEFTKYLLKTYNNSGKTFMIGNWEGDWMLGAKTVGEDADCTDEKIQQMIQWMNARGKAIEDAKKKVPHKNVNVCFYIEVNHVRRTREKGIKRMINSVVPKVPYVDYVSISGYECQGIGTWKTPQNADSLRQDLFKDLDFVEKHLPPRQIKGKRVGIGEIGYHLVYVMHKYKVSEEKAEVIQARLALESAMVNLEWGVPFYLWWELFNNEPNDWGKVDIKYKGLGLIDQDSMKKRRLWHEMKAYNDWARQYTAAVRGKTFKNPSPDVFRKAAIEWLEKRVEALRKESEESKGKSITQRRRGRREKK